MFNYACLFCFGYRKYLTKFYGEFVYVIKSLLLLKGDKSHKVYVNKKSYSSCLVRN